MFSIGAEDDDGMENPSEVATVMGSRGGSKKFKIVTNLCQKHIKNLFGS